MRRHRASSLSAKPSFGRAITVSSALAALLVLGAAAPAAATDPVDLGSSRVVDAVDVLTDGEERAVDERLRALTADGVDLWVVYVDTFTNPGEAPAWADEVAVRGGLGDHQYVLAVAVDARAYALSGADGGPVPLDEVEEIGVRQVQPALAVDDWSGAAFAAAGGLAAAVGAGDATDAGGSGVPVLTIVLGVLAAGAVGAVVVVLVRRARPRKTDPKRLPLPELARRSAAALVAADDALTSSEQELGFASAQFGAEVTARFTDTLARERASLQRAFELRQRLDDDQPESEAEARQIHAQILELCRTLEADLDAEADEFDRLRDLERNAPAVLERTRVAYHSAQDSLGDAVTVLDRLRQAYAADELTAIDDNPDQARDRLDFAAGRLEAAAAALAAGSSADAALALRGAEDAIAQAATLEAGVSSLAGALIAAERDAAALLADLERDVAAAAGIPDPDGALAPLVAATRAQIDAARADLGAALSRPRSAVAALQGANAAIDAGLAQARDAAARADRARQVLDQRMQQARAQVAAAEDFISTRRGAVGAQARTRAAEARASLDRAEREMTTDPARALSDAERALQLAGHALTAAQGDVGAFAAPSPGGSGDGMMGAVLGGIVINSLLGGSGGPSRRGSWGGGSRRSPSSGIRRSSSGFGGSRTRARRGGASGRF